MSDRDIRLAAWLDKSMDPVESEAFEAELRSDPALRAQAERWRANDGWVRDGMEALVRQPIDQAMLDRMGLGQAESPGPVAANENIPWYRSSWLPAASAVAASLAAAVLFIPRAGIDADPLSLALDSTPSLQQARLADGRTIEPTLTALAADGRWCREYLLDGHAGLACRTGSAWKVEALGGVASQADAGRIEMAGGASDEAVEEAYRRLDIADPVDGPAEAALIAKGWDGR